MDARHGCKGQGSALIRGHMRPRCMEAFANTYETSMSRILDSKVDTFHAHQLFEKGLGYPRLRVAYVLMF